MNERGDSNPRNGDRPPGGSPDANGGGVELEVHRLHIRRRVAGRRLDKYLHGRFPRISRTVLQKWIKDGMVTVNGLPSKPSYEPRPGDAIEIAVPPPPPSEIAPEDIPLDIIYEDRWLLAINKQAGIVCHPAYAAQSGTVANAVAFHAESLSREHDPFRPGIVHRLDKNTTGVMVIAKTDEAHWRISLQFERRTIKKQYFAVCHGRIALDGDLIDKPLAPHPETTQRMVLPCPPPLKGWATHPPPPVGAVRPPPRQAMFKEAVTEYRVHRRFDGYTTVKLYPKTGRTHQLRVHLSSIGHPIVGDRMYGGQFVSEHDLSGEGSTDPLIEHQALHAERLQLVHPIRETPLELAAPLSRRIKLIVELLQTHRAL